MNTAAEGRGPDRRLGRFLVVPGILATIGLLVIYPVFFLVTELFNVGDSGTFPPEEFGVGNYQDMVSDTQVLWNTAFVAGLATVMAVGFGLLLAWILTRTGDPRPGAARAADGAALLHDAAGRARWRGRSWRRRRPAC